MVVTELAELNDYKQQLMKQLCSDVEIVKLITDKKSVNVPDTSLPYKSIFPYEYIPDTVMEGQSFVCFDVDILQVLSKTFYVPVLYIWTFTHKSKMRISLADGGGVRTDKLCMAIDRILNGNRLFGLGRLELQSVGRFSPIDDYQGRVLTYTTRDFNSGLPKPAPSNRKHPDI